MLACGYLSWIEIGYGLFAGAKATKELAGKGENCKDRIRESLFKDTLSELADEMQDEIQKTQQ